jgi:hypothetical protein
MCICLFVCFFVSLFACVLFGWLVGSVQTQYRAVQLTLKPECWTPEPFDDR